MKVFIFILKMMQYFCMKFFITNFYFIIFYSFSLDINKIIENDEVKVSYEKLHAKILHHFQDENKDFHIKLFSELNNEILYDYQVYLNEKKALIKSLYDDISID